MHYLVKICHLSPLIGAIHKKRVFLSEMLYLSRLFRKIRTLVKKVIFFQTIKVFSFLHWESKTKNRIRIHARVCFLQRFKNVLLKIFHQTMRIPITKRSIYDFFSSFFEAVKPQPMCRSPVGFKFNNLGIREHFKWIL